MSSRTPEGGARNRLKAKARSRALRYLKRIHPEEFATYLRGARDKTGGCLAHKVEDCPLKGMGAHSRERKTLLDVTHHQALARLGRKYPAAYRDAYDGEVEYLREVEDLKQESGEAPRPRDLREVEGKDA